ncbi:hypothetical protein BH10PLA1_BH10PLA1_12070 [soil metagenome]
MPKSIFDPRHDGPVIGGLDNFTGESGQSYSSMPDALVDGVVETDEENDAEGTAGVDAPAVADTGEATREVAEALDEHLHDKPITAKQSAPDGPGTLTPATAYTPPGTSLKPKSDDH